MFYLVTSGKMESSRERVLLFACTGSSDAVWEVVESELR